MFGRIYESQNYIKVYGFANNLHKICSYVGDTSGGKLISGSND